MKKYTQLLVAVLMVFALFSPVFLQAGVADRIYTEGGVLIPSGGSIDNGRTNQELKQVGYNTFDGNKIGEVQHQGQTSYTALVGFEVSTRSWYTLSTEFQMSAAGFHWDGKPYKLFNQFTGQHVGTIFVSQEKEVKFYSFNVKTRFTPNKYLRPFVELCGGPMTVRSSDRTFRPDTRFDVTQITEETSAAGKFGGGLGILILPSKIGDCLEIIASGAYVQGLSGTLVKEMAFPFFSGGLKVKFS